MTKRSKRQNARQTGLIALWSHGNPAVPHGQRRLRGASQRPLLDRALVPERPHLGMRLAWITSGPLMRLVLRTEDAYLHSIADGASRSSLGAHRVAVGFRSVSRLQAPLEDDEILTYLCAACGQSPGPRQE